MARIHCEAILRITDNKLHQFEVDVVRKLEHALSVSISLNDQALIKQAKHAIMRYEHEVAEDAKPGYGASVLIYLLEIRNHYSPRRKQQK